jgi:hypothetical protein
MPVAAAGSAFTLIASMKASNCQRSSEVAGTRSLLKDSLRGGDPMRTKEQRLAIRTHRGWAISVLQEAHAIHECEYHGWARDRADPHARDHAVDIARKHPPAGLSPDAAAAQVREVLDSIGDTCPECPPPAAE